MELQILLLFFFYNSLNGEMGASHIRQKRGIIELAGVIQCETDRSSLLYVGYGCYCGIGGQGVPKDMADWCCHKHDCCYGDAENVGCHPKTNGYSWKCINHSAQCDYRNNRCQKKLCLCDKELAKCLRKAPFNASFALYPNFLCQKKNFACRYYKKLWWM